MSKYGITPGPWIWEYDERGLYGTGPDNAVLDYEDHEGMCLAYTKHREANARAIAEVPAMIEALEAFVAAEDEFRAEVTDRFPGSFSDPLAVAYERARAILSRIKGEA